MKNLSVLAFSLLAYVQYAFSQSINSNGCASGFRSGCDFFLQKTPDSVDTTSAGFSISYQGNFKIIKNLIGQGTPTYVATLCGTDTPSDATLSALGVDASADNTYFVSIPITQYGLEVQNYFSMFQELNVDDKFVFFPSSATLPGCMLDADASPKLEVAECGLDFNCFHDSWAASGVPIMFTDTFSVDFLGGNIEGGIPIVLSADDGSISISNEEKMLWYYYIAAFFNVEKTAENIINNVGFQYGCFASFLTTSNAFIAAPTVDADKVHVLYLSGFFKGSGFNGYSIGSKPSHYNEWILQANPNAVQISASDLGLSGFSFTAEQIIDAVTSSGIRVDRLILQSFLKRSAAQEVAGVDTGPEDSPDTQWSTLHDFLEDDHSNKTNLNSFAFSAYFLPDTDSWFAERPAVPHLVLSDFIAMVAPERVGNVTTELVDSNKLYFFVKYTSGTFVSTNFQANTLFGNCGNPLFSRSISCTVTPLTSFSTVKLSAPKCPAVGDDSGSGAASAALSLTTFIVMLLAMAVHLEVAAF